MKSKTESELKMDIVNTLDKNLKSIEAISSKEVDNTYTEDVKELIKLAKQCKNKRNAKLISNLVEAIMWEENSCKKNQ